MARYSVVVVTLQVMILFMCGFSYGKCSRILCICAAPSVSHQVVFREVALALRERGHELVAVTANPLHDSNLKNYTEIDVSYIYENKMSFDVVPLRGTIHWTGLFWSFASILHRETDDILNHPELKRLYAPGSGEKFDLLILESLYWPAFLPLAKRFDVPVVGLTSLGPSLNIQYSTGNPIMPSHPSNWELDTRVSGILTFWQRFVNFLWVWSFLFYYRTEYVATQKAIAKKYFGDDVPDILDMESNYSLILTNYQLPIFYIRPNLPNVIEIGGFHGAEHTKSLPQDLEKILDNATQGFVYMSLGSNVQSKELTSETRGQFIAAFSKLPYTVLWKFEDDHLPNKPDNVVIMKWVPQLAVLAHPNIKVFIYQGGLQSTEEAISAAVPVIAYPVMADQEMQATKMTSLGVGKKLEITDVKADELVQAIHSIALDGSWKRRMMDLRSLLNDKPQNALEKAIWWVEHVIRHRGAPYLRSDLVDEPWYRRQDFDILFVISAGIIIALSLSLVALYKLIIYSGLKFYVSNKPSISQKKKT